ncbi:MAG: hypothetical protein ACR2GP_10150 [Burkholderiaceae bacterium]
MTKPLFNPFQNPFLKSFELWSSLARNNATMLWSAGEVIGRRTTRMAQHGAVPNENDRREMHRMVSEKQSAIAEASQAAWSQWMQSSQAMWTDALFAQGAARNPSNAATRLLNAQLSIANAAMKPLQKRVAANQKRLSGKR